jgi:hypothetical protein
MATMLPLPTRGELATIKSLEGDEYTLTPEDAEWAVRMAVFEGGDPAITLWVMAQRWVLFQRKGAGYTSFARFLQAFSQPINPKWARDGEFCKEGGRYSGTDYCDASKLARRELAQSSLQVVAAKDPVAYAIAVAWLKAEIPNTVPRGTNFSDERVADAYLAKTPGATELTRTPPDTCPACNVVIVERDAKDWPADYVWMVTPNGNVADSNGVRGGGVLARFTSGVARALTRWWA